MNMLSHLLERRIDYHYEGACLLSSYSTSHFYLDAYIYHIDYLFDFGVLGSIYHMSVFDA
jgi:hypothetical protein